MKMFLFYTSSIFALILGNAQNAFAACEVGPILFRDTLYGTAIGGGVGALVLIANSDSTNIAPTFAAAALVGAGAGVIIGVVEISLSNCSGGHKSRDENYGYGLKVRPLFSVADNQIARPSLQSNDTSFHFNEIGGGVTVEYSLN